MSDEAFLAGYDGVEVELTDGTTITARPLSVKQFARFWRLYVKAGEGDGAAMMEILDELPQAIGREDLKDDLTPAELIALVPAFFSATRPGKLPKKGPPETETNGQTAKNLLEARASMI